MGSFSCLGQSFDDSELIGLEGMNRRLTLNASMPRRSLLTARSSHARGSNTIFAAILSARCAAPLTAGCANDAATAGNFFF